MLSSTGYQDKHDTLSIDERVRRGLSAEQSVPELEEDHLYFVYRTSGVFSRPYSSRHTEDMQDELRSFFGCLIAFSIFYEFRFLLNGGPPAIVSNAYRSKDDSELVGVTALDTDIRDTFGYFLQKEHRDSGASIDELVKSAIDLFRSSESSRLKTAASWLFKAYISGKPIDQALTSAIAIEVLLGDRDTSDRIGLSKLMANRCAYALGKSQKDRKSLSDLFIKFYKVSSEIVHAGRYKVSQEDTQVVQQGRALAARLLKHEVGVS